MASYAGVVTGNRCDRATGMLLVTTPTMAAVPVLSPAGSTAILTLVYQLNERDEV
ncbi:hypothetical protein [Dyadobacter aurulentus]|uniref:hypothetical protein n=1 Tax=Dyadobacter sp. UC 10 TaxID=2605428 RepID=UPI001788C75E|nr:hypothetical protein [Dyadobacter sp. UC 10]